jgi:hypothetical protein
MSKQKIKLGDEIQDITAKVSGIAIGFVQYLDGSSAWLLQPPYSADGNRVPTVEVQDAYAVRCGDGVYAKPKPIMGFHARNGLNSNAK